MADKWVIICIELTGSVDEFSGPIPNGMMLRRFDPEYAEGRGHAEWTHDPDVAMKFDDQMSALELWKTQSKTRPLRDDGLPNRPLTAYTIVVERL